jgi:uncharacterized protein YndB with AHSA1/START domain
MADAHDPRQSADEVSLRIDAPPERIYEIVTDIRNMGRLSPECTGGRWLGSAAGPVVGSRFKGSNRRGWVRWSTVNEVVAAEPAREFAFETQQSGMRWTYRIEPDGEGSVVTERRERYKARTGIATVFTKLALGGVEEHDDELRAGMRATLERLKAVAEAQA